MKRLWRWGGLGVSEWNLGEWCEFLKLLYKYLHRGIDRFFASLTTSVFPGMIRYAETERFVAV